MHTKKEACVCDTSPQNSIREWKSTLWRLWWPQPWLHTQESILRLSRWGWKRQQLMYPSIGLIQHQQSPACFVLCHIVFPLEDLSLLDLLPHFCSHEAFTSKLSTCATIVLLVVNKWRCWEDKVGKSGSTCCTSTHQATWGSGKGFPSGAKLHLATASQAAINSLPEEVPSSQEPVFHPADYCSFHV